MVWITTEVNISLDEIDDDDLVNHLKSRGYELVKSRSEEGDGVSPDDLERIDHLLVCGQKQAAIEEIFSVVGHAIGREITH